VKKYAHSGPPVVISIYAHPTSASTKGAAEQFGELLGKRA